jgi:hypothetical protein
MCAIVKMGQHPSAARIKWYRTARTRRSGGKCDESSGGLLLTAQVAAQPRPPRQRGVRSAGIGSEDVKAPSLCEDFGAAYIQCRSVVLLTVSIRTKHGRALRLAATDAFVLNPIGTGSMGGGDETPSRLFVR